MQAKSHQLSTDHRKAYELVKFKIQTTEHIEFRAIILYVIVYSTKCHHSTIILQYGIILYTVWRVDQN